MNEDAAVPAPDAEGKKPQKKLLWSKAALDEFDLAEKIGKAAKLPVHAPTLKERELPDRHAENLLALVTGARGYGADAVGAESEGLGETIAESGERDNLLSGLRDIHAAARQRYHAAAPEKLAAFGIGARLDTLSFARLTGVAEAVLARLGEENLPGVKAEKIAALQATLDAYKSADAGQTGKKSEASALRQSRDDALTEIRKARQVIQFAADGAWPYTEAKNKPMRDAFHLPPGKPYTG